jgi:hypothetical protein
VSHDPTLESALRAVEPALRLVRERHLRHVLSFLNDRARALPTGPELPYWITRADLAAADVLPPDALGGTEPRLLLVTAPADRFPADLPPAVQRRAYWRVLFRAAVMAEIDRRLAAGTLTPELCRARLDRFGPPAGREIRFVLASDQLVAPTANDADLYRTFAAVYLDYALFAGRAAEAVFPSLPPRAHVCAALADDVPIDALFRGSRPADAADPEPDAVPADAAGEPPAPEAPADGGAVRLLRRAAAAEQKGNLVRAAVLRQQASAAPGGDRMYALSAARGALRKLVNRLGDVLEWDAGTRDEWHRALAPLLPHAAVGIWPRAARGLYELQRIPADFARDVYAVDLPEYIRTLGRRPVRRHLPHSRPVLILMAFRTAHKQLLRAGLTAAEQERLDHLLHREMRRRAEGIRAAFTPIVVTALTAAGLVPACRAEVVARDKLVAELLDRVCEGGYLRIGDLRDAVARGRLKLSDLSGPGEFVAGDALLRADNGLAYALDGVYRRGEFYLRWIQRFASVFFGTPWGRAVTLYLALPFGGAFLLLMSVAELRQKALSVEEFVARSFQPKPARPAADPAPAADPPPPPPADGSWQFDEETGEMYRDDRDNLFVWQSPQGREAVGKLAKDVFFSSAAHDRPEEQHHIPGLITWPAVGGLGVFFLLLLHAPPFRRAVFRAVVLVWRGVRGVLWDLPAALWNAPPVRAVRLSTTVRFLRRRCATPVLLSLVLLALLFLAGANPRILAWDGWVLAACLVVLYNLPFAMNLQDRFAGALSDWWRRVHSNFLPGMFGAVLDFFRWLGGLIERQLYAVDEWMRFRSGDSQGSLAAKAVLGLVWFPFAYVTRFAFYLLVEPQINPVKHFPVVSVSHKMMLPMIPDVATWTGLSELTVTTVIAGIPGVFGFIAWELKENWRLYAANRPRTLEPVTIGSHGESMRGLLRPGFHSGTVPKVYRKVRRALAADDRVRAALQHHDLEHVGEGVERFVARELLPLLAGCGDWGGVVVAVADVRFGAQRAVVELAAPALGPDPVVIAFENVGGEIEAAVAETGWADKLTDAQRGVLLYALRGLLDMGAAARYDGRDRTAAAADAPGFGALARPVAWVEWAQRWDRGTMANDARCA